MRDLCSENQSLPELSDDEELSDDDDERTEGKGTVKQETLRSAASERCGGDLLWRAECAVATDLVVMARELENVTANLLSRKESDPVIKHVPVSPSDLEDAQINPEEELRGAVDANEDLPTRLEHMMTQLNGFQAALTSWITQRRALQDDILRLRRENKQLSTDLNDAKDAILLAAQLEDDMQTEIDRQVENILHTQCREQSNLRMEADALLDEVMTTRKQLKIAQDDLKAHQMHLHQARLSEQSKDEEVQRLIAELQKLQDSTGASRASPRVSPDELATKVNEEMTRHEGKSMRAPPPLAQARENEVPVASVELDCPVPWEDVVALARSRILLAKSGHDGSHGTDTQDEKCTVPCRHSGRSVSWGSNTERTYETSPVEYPWFIEDTYQVTNWLSLPSSPRPLPVPPTDSVDTCSAGLKRTHNNSGLAYNVVDGIITGLKSSPASLRNYLVPSKNIKLRSLGLEISLRNDGRWLVVDVLKGMEADLSKQIQKGDAIIQVAAEGKHAVAWEAPARENFDEQLASLRGKGDTLLLKLQLADYSLFGMNPKKVEQLELDAYELI